MLISNRSLEQIHGQQTQNVDSQHWYLVGAKVTCNLFFDLHSMFNHRKSGYFLIKEGC